MSLTRRLLLAAAGAVPLLRLARSPTFPQAKLADRLRRIIAAPASARVVGRLYRTVDPTDASCAAATILASLPSQVQAGDEAALRAYLIAAIRADFREGRTVGVAGFVLSRTELRLASLWA